MATADDVPGKYDVVIDGNGFLYADTQDIKAEYGYSPTFVQRTNVEGDYGDNKQDFWLTFSQRDWSLGENQKFYRSDASSSRRFWSGSAIDVRVPGQVSMRQAVKTVTAAAAVNAITGFGLSGARTIAAASATNLYYINYDGSITDQGAHGLGATPTGIATDNTYIYLTGEGVGSVGVRSWNPSAGYATFSVSPARELEYLNNTLFAGNFLSTAAYVGIASYSAAGAWAAVYPFKDAKAGPLQVFVGKIRAYGGKLLVMLNVPSGTELWVYDGQGTSLVAKLPPNFFGARIEVLHGIAFVSGVFVKKDDSTNRVDIPGIYFYNNGQIGLLWQSNTSMTVSHATSQEHQSPAMCTFDSGLVFTDDSTGRFMFYDIINGGVHPIGGYTVAGTLPLLASNHYSLLHTRNQTTTYLYPDAASIATTATVLTSLADFDSSLTKRFKSVKMDADIPAGSSIDLAYQLEDVTGSYVSAQTGAVSGTEYAIGANGRSISIKATLNKGSSAAGPTLRRIYVRAVPLPQGFRLHTYVLNCTGKDGDQPITLRDGTLETRDGLAMATQLRTSMASTVPITITDEFGTFTGIILPDQSKFQRVRVNEFIVVLAVREV